MPPLPPVAHPRAAWQVYRMRMLSISRFTLMADTGVVAGNHGASFSIRWICAPVVSQMDGFGPLGQTVFRLRINKVGAQLVTDRGRYYAHDAGRLLARLTGWRLPIGGLRYWILGIPAPRGRYHVILNTTGQLRSLRQAGWVVRYRRYVVTRFGVLPKRLSLQRSPTVRAPGVLIHIVVGRWRNIS